MSLSKNKIKYIHSLKDKKHREQNNTFVAEGEKLVFDLMHTTKCQLIAGIPEIINKIPNTSNCEIIIASHEELKKASHLKNPSPIIGVFYKPEVKPHDLDFTKGLHIILDNIQDPGNLGTIVRIADWFGIDTIICSLDTVDIFNPKTVQATMGAIARIKTLYTDIELFLKQNNKLPVYGTYLEGNNIYSEKLHQDAFIVMGNEGKGISNSIENHITNKLFIPNYPISQKTSESLNVGVATGIICSEFRRGQI